MAYDPIFRARMPDPYFDGQNFGAPGVDPSSQGWNVNSAYLTPTFMAGYRPNYSGPSNFQNPYMGFWRGMNNATPTPIQPDVPYYASHQQYRQDAMHAVTTGVADGIGTAYQFAGGAAVALAVQGAAQANIWRTLPGMGSSNSFWGGVKAFGHALTGGSSADIALARSSQLPLEALGRSVGSVAGRGVGWAASGVINSGARMMGIQGRVALGGMGASIGAGAGAAFGGIVAPFAVGMAAAEAMNKGVFSPYTYGRQTSEAFYENFKGQYTGTGTTYTPMGMGARTANKLGFEVSRDFMNMMSFKGDSGAQIATFGMQNGLYSDISGGNTDNLRKRTRDIAEQVKVVMQVFNEPSMQEAIKMLGQMANTGGVKGIAGISRLGSAFSTASALSGTSTQQLMNTVAQQGQYMFGQAGLVPYLGQIAALNAHTGIAQAYKSGLISSNALAMMGGKDGATQAILQAQLGMSQSPYNKILAHNQYNNLKGAGGGIVDNLAAFGNDLAKDPLRASGRFFATQNTSVSEQLKKDPNAFMKQVFHMLDMMGPQAKNKNGQYSWEAIAADFQQRGLDPNQANAVLTLLQAQGGKDVLRKLGEVNKATYRDQLRGTLEQESMLYGGLGEASRWWKKGVMNPMQIEFSERLEKNSDFFGAVGDAAHEFLFDVSRASVDGPPKYTTTLKGRASLKDTFFRLGDRGESHSWRGVLGRIGNTYQSDTRVASAINKMKNGFKFKNLNTEDQKLLKRTLGFTDENMDLAIGEFNSGVAIGDIVLNKEGGGSVSEVAKEAALSGVAGAFSEENRGSLWTGIGKTLLGVATLGMSGFGYQDGDFGGLNETIGTEMANKLKAQGSVRISALGKFALESSEILSDSAKMEQAIKGNAYISSELRKAGFSNIKDQLALLRGLQGAANSDGRAQASFESGDSTGVISSEELGRRIARRHAQLSAGGMGGKHAASSAMGRLDANTQASIRAANLAKLEQYDQASAAAKMSGSIDFSGFERAVGTQMDASLINLKAAQINMANAVGDKERAKQLSEEANFLEAKSVDMNSRW